MILRSGQSVAWFPAVTVSDTPYIATGANLGVGGTCFYASSQAQRPTSMIAVFRNLLPASIQEVDDPESPAALCSDSATDSAGEGGERQQALIHSFRSASSTRQIDAKTTKNSAEESVSLFASDGSALPRQPAWPFSMPDVQPSITGVRVDSGAGRDMPPKRLRSEGSAGVAQNTECAADASSPTRAAIAGPAEWKVGVTTGQAGFFSDNQQAQLSIAAIGELTPKRVDGSTGRLPHGGEQSTPVLQASQTSALVSTQAGTTDVAAQSTLQGEEGEAPRPISQGLALGRGASANSFNGDWDQTTEKAGNSPRADFPPQLAESVATAKRQDPADWSDSPAAVSTQSRQVAGAALDPSVQSQSGGSASSSLAIAISPQPDITDVSGHVLALDWRRSSTAGLTGSGLGKESAPSQIASSQSPSFTAAPTASRIEPTAPQPGSAGSVTLKESFARFVSSTYPANPRLGNAEMGLGRYDRREIVQTPALIDKPTGGEHVHVDQSARIANTGTAQTTMTSTVFAKQDEAQEASRPLALDESADGVQESTLAGQPSPSSAAIELNRGSGSTPE